LEDLSAFVDGELAPERAAEIAEAIRRNPALLDQLDSYRQQTKSLHALYDPVLHAPLPDNLSQLARRFGKEK
jgi:anti-sigma factor RsiW